MMQNRVDAQLPDSIAQAVPLLIDFPVRRFWVDYDKEADVLYISLQRPQKATNTRITDDGILLRYKGEHLVGVTVLDASTRSCTRANRLLLTSTEFGTVGRIK